MEETRQAQALYKKYLGIFHNEEQAKERAIFVAKDNASEWEGTWVPKGQKNLNLMYWEKVVQELEKMEV